MLVAAVGSGGGGRRLMSMCESELIISKKFGAVVEVVVQASGFARGVSIPVFISVFPFFFYQCPNSRLSGLHMLCISDFIVALFYFICLPCGTMGNDILFEYCFDESIILTEETLVLEIIQPETEVCHETVDIRTIMPMVLNKKNRKRALSSRKFFVQVESLFVQLLSVSIQWEIHDWLPRGADTWKKRGATSLQFL